MKKIDGLYDSIPPGNLIKHLLELARKASKDKDYQQIDTGKKIKGSIDKDYGLFYLQAIYQHIDGYLKTIGLKMSDVLSISEIETIWGKNRKSASLF